MTDLVAPDNARWEPVPSHLADKNLALGDDRELSEPGFDLKALLLLLSFSALHLVGSSLKMYFSGVTAEVLLWFAIGVVTAIYAAMAAWRSKTRSRHYYLLPAGIIRHDRYGRHFLSHQRIDDLITREISDNGRAAVELLLTDGEWVQMKVDPGEVHKVQRWFDEVRREA